MNTNEIKATAANPVESVGNPAEEVRQEGDTQTPAEPSKLDNLRSMMSSRYPDQQFGTDDDIYAKIADDYAANDKEIARYKEQEGKIKNLFTRDARSAKFMSDWMEGGDPVIAMIEQYGDDFRTALDDPEMKEKLAEANKKFVEQLAEEKKLEDEYNKNIEESIAVLDELEEKEGISGDKLDDAILHLKTIANDVFMGKFTKEAIQAALKAQNYDADVESAAQEAEVRGRNAKVEEQLRKPKQTDGMPQLGSRSTGGSAPQRPKVAGALGREKKSIWDVGGGIKRGK